MYAYLTHKGSHPRRITCVGHSLGAHICGMMGNHLSTKQHKIIGNKIDYTGTYYTPGTILSPSLFPFQASIQLVLWSRTSPLDPSD